MLCPHLTSSPILCVSLCSQIKATDVGAVEVGGTTEGLVLPGEFNQPMGFGKRVLNAVGSVVLFNNDRNVMGIYGDKMEFMREESCRQCIPCKVGECIYPCL